MKDINALSVTLSDLELAAETGNASQDIVKSISSDLLYLFRQAQQLAAIPEQPITDAHIQMVIDSHEKGYAMIIPCKIDLTLALEVRRLRRAMNPETAADDISWWKQEAEDCKRLLLERVKENDDLRRSLAQYESAPAPDSRHSAAVATLESSGYTYHGGQFWKPPIGKAPAYITGAQPKSELLQRAEKLAEECGALAQRVQGEDLRAKVRADHAEWATATFGNTGPVGPLKHLSKEALEAAEAPQDLHEWADMQFLFWDAQRKAGVTDEQITAAMVEKLEINKARQWPEPKDGEPRFHIKGQ